MITEITTSKGRITIRPAVPENAALVLELRLEALKQHPEVFAADYASAAAESVQAWSDRIIKYATDNTGIINLGFKEDQLIGMTGLNCSNHPKTRHNGNIWGVYVKADYRKFHIAEALIKGCLSWGQTHGLVMAKLAVITINSAAIRCYTRCGFTVYGVDPKVIHYNDVFYDELLMARPV